MTRTKLIDRTLPNYSRGEEIFNMVSHIVGGGLSIIMLIACVALAVMRENLAGVITGAVFGVSAILLYTMSSVYHGLIPEMPKKVMQVLDHCAIYILIAGTYTPLLVCGLRSVNPKLSWVMLGIVWFMAALATTLTAIDLKKFKVLSMICYIGIGWSVVFIIKPLFQALGTGGFIFLFAGGIIYTIGAILYGIGHSKRRMHNVFHLFVIAGTILHFLCIVLYVL